MVIQIMYDEQGKPVVIEGYSWAKALVGKMKECDTCLWKFGKCNHRNPVLEACEIAFRWQIEVVCQSCEPMGVE
jgi:hypothetical protein